MKKYSNFEKIALFCLVGLASCTNQPTVPASASTPVSLRNDASLPNRLYQDVNTYRRNRGASDLQRHAGLDRLAQNHCEYLRQHRGSFSLNGKNVSHIGFDGRYAMAKEAYQMANVSENVAVSNKASNNTTQDLITLWKGSNDHHKNMLDTWSYTGLGVVVDSDGMVFATQIFATKNNSQMSTRERFNHH